MPRAKRSRIARGYAIRNVIHEELKSVVSAPPLFERASASREGMESYSALMRVMGVLSHSSWTQAHSSCLFRGKPLALTRLAMCDQTCSMGLKSGELPGQSRRVIPFWYRNAFVDLARWGGAPSCWKILFFLGWAGSKLHRSATSNKILSWYFLASRVPSISRIGPIAPFKMAPHTCTFSPFFGFWRMHFWERRSPFLLVTRGRVPISVTSNCFSAVKTTRDQKVRVAFLYFVAKTRRFSFCAFVNKGRMAATLLTYPASFRRLPTDLWCRAIPSDFLRASARSGRECVLFARARRSRHLSCVVVVLRGRPDRGRSATNPVSFTRRTISRNAVSETLTRCLRSSFTAVLKLRQVRYTASARSLCPRGMTLLALRESKI